MFIIKEAKQQTKMTQSHVKDKFYHFNFQNKFYAFVHIFVIA